MRRLLWLTVIALFVVCAPAFAGGTQEGDMEDVEATTAGEGATIARYNEAPMLAEMVQAGEIPPVDERLPEQPLVLEPNDEIGKYGGQFVIRQAPQRYWYERSNLILNREATESDPNVILGYEFNSDGTEFTMYLREGLKWSNGDPVDADDWLFSYYDVDGNEELNTTTPSHMEINDEPVEMTKVDQWTVKLTFPKPFYGVINKMNTVGARHFYGPRPDEWMKQYHIKYNEDADALAQEAGFDHWWQYFRQIADMEQAAENFVGEKIGRPEVGAWVFDEETPTAYTFVRNPYYFKVDPDGNQLPYIDRAVGMKIEDQEVILLKALNGELDIAGWGLAISDFPTLKKNEEQGKYNAWVAKDLWGSATVYCINQTYVGDNADIVNPYLQNVKFRQALSVAINREEVNELVGLGQGTPRQATLHPDTIGFKEEWAEAYAQYDPDLANSLLDEIGLTARNNEGFRMDPNGNLITLDVPIRPLQTYWVETTELVREYWQAVGIKVNVRNVGNVLHQMADASTLMVFTWAFDRVFGPAFIEASGSWLNPAFWFGPIGPLWANWLTTDGEAGEEPPQVVQDLYEACQDIQYVSPEEQTRIIEFIGDSYAENLWMIGTVGMMGKPIVRKKALGNVRRDLLPDNISVPANEFREQYYWTDPARRGE